MPNKMMFIINPRSGKNKKQTLFENVESIIRSEDYDVTTFYTEYRGHAAKLAQNSEKYDRVVCMGGDGTLNEVCNGLMLIPKNIRPSIGYIPAGSTNDFAIGLGLPRSISKSAKLACTQELNPIDIGVFKNNSNQTQYFSYVASFGAFTNISYSTAQNAKNKFGHLAYIFEGIKTINELLEFRPFYLKIQTEDMILEQEYIFGAVTNSTSLGGLVKLDKKHVRVNDGLFELLLVRKPKNIFELTETATQLINHKYNFERIVFSHINNVSFSSDQPLDWTLDGEYAGTTEFANISVSNLALDFARKELIRKKPLFRKTYP